MYLSNIHSTYHFPTLYAFIKSHPLGLLITTIPSPEHPTLQSSHLPFVLDIPSDLTPSDFEAHSDLSDLAHSVTARIAKSQPLGTLRAHIARANPQAKALIAAAKAHAAGITTDDVGDATPTPDGGVTLPEEVLIMFNGPVQHYVTPKFYTVTKPDTGKVVPTWNYEAVEVYGRVTVYPSTTSEEADEFLSKAIGDLTHMAEIKAGYDGNEGRQEEWEVDDAPEKFIGVLKKAIVGVSIEVTRLGGKFKMSQEMKEGDREGVAQGFANIGKIEMSESVKTWAERAKER